jgi:hypothetical protein
MGQSRRFDRLAITSVLPSATDLREMRQGVHSLIAELDLRTRSEQIPTSRNTFEFIRSTFREHQTRAGN